MVKALTLLMIFFLHVCHATTIVFYIEKDQIIAAADSLGSPIVQGRKLDFGVMQPKIMIGTNGDVILAATGLLANRGADYDALAIMWEAFTTNHVEDYCSNAVTRIEVSCSNHLFTVFNGPGGEELFQGLADVPLKLVVAHFHEGVPEFFKRTFAAYRDDSGTGFQISIVGRACRRFDTMEFPRATFALGQTNAIKEQLADADYWQDKNPLERTANLIATEIKAEPESVGWPIRIVRLSKSGVRWKYLNKAADIDALSKEK